MFPFKHFPSSLVGIHSHFIDFFISRVSHKRLSGGESNWQLVGERSISAHVNIPKRKFERKIMLHGLHHNCDSMHVHAFL